MTKFVTKSVLNRKINESEDFYYYEATDTFDNVKSTALITAYENSRSKYNGHLVVRQAGVYVNHVFWTHYGFNVNGEHLFSGVIYTHNEIVRFKYIQNYGFWQYKVVDDTELIKKKQITGTTAASGAISMDIDVTKYDIISARLVNVVNVFALPRSDSNLMCIAVNGTSITPYGDSLVTIDIWYKEK